MRTIHIRRDYYDKKDYIYRKADIEIKPGLTVLVGCNGCGKTTFLNHVRMGLEKEDVGLVSFNNVVEGGHNAMDKAMWHGDMRFVMRAAISSEGEKIWQNMEQLAISCRKAFLKAVSDGKKELWVILDAVDSGFSVDNIDDLKNQLFKALAEDCESKGIELYILAAANEYEMARGENCLDVQGGKYIRFGSYESYRNFVLKTRKWKDKRYSRGGSDGKGEKT